MSFLNNMMDGWFSPHCPHHHHHHVCVQRAAAGAVVAAPASPSPAAGEGRKRSRDEVRTPILVTSGEEDRPLKKLRYDICVRVPHLQEDGEVEGATSEEKRKKESSALLLRLLPEEVVGHALGFLGSATDRFALQTTCKQFKRISDTDKLLVNVELGGDQKTGKHAFLMEEDTPATGAARLVPFAKAGNLEAIYMLGMIKSYCHQDVESGIHMLRLAAQRGYLRAHYTLGLILRDSVTKEATKYMKDAATEEYLPALQEVLSAREMKAKYGEPKADELRRYLDPVCLNRLLGRHYLDCSALRELNTSHCWNPLCGRWAFKAQVSSNGTPIRPIRRRRFLGAASTFRRARSPLAAASPAAVTVAAPPAANIHGMDLRISRMKMCSRCCRAKYCSKLCQVYDWRSGRHKMECQFL